MLLKIVIKWIKEGILLYILCDPLLEKLNGYIPRKRCSQMLIRDGNIAGDFNVCICIFQFLYNNHKVGGNIFTKENKLCIFILLKINFCELVKESH